MITAAGFFGQLKDNRLEQLTQENAQCKQAFMQQKANTAQCIDDCSACACDEFDEKWGGIE
jgi:hypothetical protein